jgi:hypothetical protein
MPIYEYSKRAGALMNRSFIKVKQNAISRCGHLECNDIGICEMWTSPECTGTMLTDATFWKVCGKALLL